MAPKFDDDELAILRKLSDHDLLIGLHGKVNSLISTSKDHEKRLRGLEMWRNLQSGAIAVLTFLAAVIEPLLWLRKK
jgi:phage replication-related protein YjqB (UPF0714/DUF867 family)